MDGIQTSFTDYRSTSVWLIAVSNAISSCTCSITPLKTFICANYRTRTYKLSLEG